MIEQHSMCLLNEHILQQLEMHSNQQGLLQISTCDTL